MLGSRRQEFDASFMTRVALLVGGSICLAADAYLIALADFADRMQGMVTLVGLVVLHITAFQRSAANEDERRLFGKRALYLSSAVAAASVPLFAAIFTSLAFKAGITALYFWACWLLIVTRD